MTSTKFIRRRVCAKFSFDVRGRAFNKALNWSDSTAVGPRAYFVTVTKPAALSLEAVQLDDEGIYRCRVDFKNSPTKNFQVNLTVIGTSFITVTTGDRDSTAVYWPDMIERAS